MSRIITAAIVLPFLIASILISWLEPLFVFLAAVAMILALYEFYLLAKKRDLRPDVTAMFLASAALFTTFFFDRAGRLGDLLLMNQVVIIVLTAGTLVAGTLRGAQFEKLLASTGATILGVIYIALFGGYLVALRTGFEPLTSAHLLSFFFLVIMGSDTGAYYIGRAFGKNKLAPNISPGKTWEGVVGGVIVGVGMGLISHYWFFRELPLKWILPLAGIMVVVGILGDLVESALKRGAGAKDAANILPGHGGLLDRLDSLLFNAPLLYYFARLFPLN
jgi:phosphatidate cytidylyltransferase